MAIKDKFFSWFGKGKKSNEDETETVETPQEDVTEAQTSDTQEKSELAPELKPELEPELEQPSIDVALKSSETAPEQDEMAAMFDEAATTPVEHDEMNAMLDEVAAPLVAKSAPAPEPEILAETKNQSEPEQDEMGAMFDEVATADIDVTADIDALTDIDAQDAPEQDEMGAMFDEVANTDVSTTVDIDAIADNKAEPEPEEEPEPVKKEGFFARLKKGLSKTKTNLGSGFVSLFRGKKIDDELFEDLETQLLIADVGVETSMKLVENLTKHASRKQLKDAEALYDLLKQEMAELLGPVEQPIEPVNPDGPYVILMVGVNGVGKTTTIGKMAKQFQEQGKSVMLAAGDTFRAAAVEQLTVWGDRNDIPVVAQHTGADSASVIFDAIQSAKTRNIDVIIADTAGRLQNKDHLMEELKKIVRVMKKLDVNAPHEVMLTLDAGTGQNALSQVNLFSKAVGLTGLTISKLDGTAKGGVVFAIADKFSIPIRYIGVGEGIDDLRAFNSKDFIDALFAHDE